MADEIPEMLDCRRMAGARETLKGTVDARKFSRIRGNFRVAGDTEVSLQVNRSEANQLFLVGSFAAPMSAECQRCMTPMSLTLQGEFELRIVETESEAEIEDESIVASEGHLSPLLVIEDEILLACPMIPLHDTESCHPSDSDSSAKTERQRPFAGLDQLIKNSESKD